MFGNWGKALQRQVRRLGRDERAVTAVEFGMLALPFFSVIGAIMQTSVVFLTAQVLESAVNDASRAIRTGQSQAGNVTMEQFRSDVCSRTYGLIPDCAGLHVRVNVITNFQAASAAPPLANDCTAPCDWTETETWGPGGGKSVVLVQVYYRYPIFVQLGPLGMSNMGDGRRLIGSATVFQNEPFS
ncbi:pilus assembly protein [Devosia sp. XJ19-1]|uniref:Pilus assembly protein n=1 Tax=Devosia ureilytica TaxID=2952754 RepID=A0A9Q4ARA6_9HYPH|nr:pilus assembly protein [Devosia ureilytica]MCP8888717.1 pilus assembly protein [Devosia ureilytica]